MSFLQRATLATVYQIFLVKGGWQQLHLPLHYDLGKVWPWFAVAWFGTTDTPKAKEVLMKECGRMCAKMTTPVTITRAIFPWTVLRHILRGCIVECDVTTAHKQFFKGLKLINYIQHNFPFIWFMVKYFIFCILFMYLYSTNYIVNAKVCFPKFRFVTW